MTNLSTFFRSESAVRDIIGRADDDHETRKLIRKFHDLKKIRVPFYLTSSDFDEILRWKLRGQYGRLIKFRERNTDQNVRAITQAAFIISHDDQNYETELRLRILVTLGGVEVPVASAIMTLCYPDKYCVIDFRGWRQVINDDSAKTTYTPKDYIKYLSIVRKMASSLGVTPQEMDMAIWQKDIETNYTKN